MGVENPQQPSSIIGRREQLNIDIDLVFQVGWRKFKTAVYAGSQTTIQIQLHQILFIYPRFYYLIE